MIEPAVLQGKAGSGVGDGGRRRCGGAYGNLAQRPR